MSNEKRKPDLNAFVVTGTVEKPFYTKIGGAWQNKTGGYGIELDAIPVNGRLVLFPPKEKDEGQKAK